MKGSLLLYNLKLNCLIFSTGLNGSLIIFIWTYTVNYRNALDRLCVCMNIVLFISSIVILRNYHIFIDQYYHDCKCASSTSYAVESPTTEKYILAPRFKDIG